jgi:hypothetical protein
MNIREYYPYKCMKWIPEPVALFACAKNPLEPLTTYAGRYTFTNHWLNTALPYNG